MNEWMNENNKRRVGNLDMGKYYVIHVGVWTFGLRKTESPYVKQRGEMIKFALENHCCDFSVDVVPIVYANAVLLSLVENHEPFQKSIICILSNSISHHGKGF